MSDGILIAWFTLTALSLAFVVVDIPKTPEATVLKWAFVILTVFSGPFGAFFYVLGCREPLKGTHAEYVSATWRQVLGSTMHCAAGDGIGIIAGAVIGAFLALSEWGDFALEYALGFGFGWVYFQAFAMRDMAGGSFSRSLKETFIPELVSMNVLMAGMLVTMKTLMPRLTGANDPLTPAFWFVMSMALMVGFAAAYPVNWWLVTRNMKHGMLTLLAHVDSQGHEGMAGMDDTGVMDEMGDMDDMEGHDAPRPGPMAVAGVVALTFAILALALWVTIG
ncbi:MAG TPA: DUF4396 domain-containing protein [Aliiroseovarius sp.]|nr:DUF4396 domain-containing protein [Aliiroseovarius sp.]